ncbi:TPA: hypothetical protein N0F65_006349, partial [Lagenidium giganteum]
TLRRASNSQRHCGWISSVAISATAFPSPPPATAAIMPASTTTIATAQSTRVTRHRLTVIGLPRTSEILWDGKESLAFTLKRKRSGAILVTQLKDTTAPMELRVGSELKLVGGFPVQHLTLTEVKKVMVRAPKPVSLVFMNHEELVWDNASFISDPGRLSDEQDVDGLYQPMAITRSESNGTSSCSSEAENSPSTQRRRLVRKPSKLKIAFERVNSLLNRPVRQSALNISTGKSIVV